MATVQFERHPHDREHPYSIISNDVIRHPTLSLDTIALLIRMLSLPSGWRMTEESLRKFGRVQPIGDRVMRRMMSELREHGYLEKVAIRDDTGRVTEWKWYVREQPKPADEKPSDDGFSQKGGNRHSGSDCVSAEKMPSQGGFSQNGGFAHCGKCTPIRSTESPERLSKQSKKDGDACLLPLERENLKAIQDTSLRPTVQASIARQAAVSGWTPEELKKLWELAKQKADTNPAGLFLSLFAADGLAQVRALSSREKSVMEIERVNTHREMVDLWSEQFGHAFFVGRTVQDGIMRFRNGLEIDLRQCPTLLEKQLSQISQSIWESSRL